MLPAEYRPSLCSFDLPSMDGRDVVTICVGSGVELLQLSLVRSRMHNLAIASELYAKLAKCKSI
jgi:hypothetical protein